MTPVALTLALLLTAARAAPITSSGRRTGFLGASRGARIGFIVGMVVLCIIIALLALWTIFACCCAGRASGRPRGPGLFARSAATVPPLGTTAPPIAKTAATHYGFGVPGGRHDPAASAGAPAATSGAPTQHVV